jgi:dienelactone hydrolase
MSHDTPKPPRNTVRISTPSGQAIEAWIYLPEGTGPHPAVVMAHGIGAVKAGGLQPFAERFRDEGFAAIVFDYRQWGGSDGEPRDELSVPRQLQDYRTVIDWTAAQPNIDPNRIVAWGTSFAGMHIIELAASDRRLAAAIAQVPLVDGSAGAAMIPPLQGLRLTMAAVLDRLGSFIGRPVRYIPNSAAPGQLAIGATDDALYGLKLMTPTEPANFHNRVAARSVLSVATHRPVRRAAAIRGPILLVVAQDDTMAPTGPALRVAEKAPRAELYRSRGGHYDVYEGGKDHDAVLRTEVEFLHRHLGA